MRNLRFSLAALAIVTSGCAGARSSPAPLPEPAIAAESASIAVIAPGVKHRQYWIASGPWAVNVLDVDRSACWTPWASSARRVAVGRTRTSDIYAYWTRMTPDVNGGIVAGAVNADFFSLVTGAPVGAFIHLGTMITGPVNRPVFGLDSARAPFIGMLALSASVAHAGVRTPVRWNRPLVNDISLNDRLFAERTDTATGAVEFTLRRIRQRVPVESLFKARDGTSIAVVESMDTSASGVDIPDGGLVLIVGARADSVLRSQLLTLTVGDSVMIARTFPNGRPNEAVGGYPILVTAGAIAGVVDSAGNAGFRNRNPRTAVGISANGRRLLFVTVDGRQPPYSDGMTLRELAVFMRSLGAEDALNLDGGGSTTMVVRDTTAERGFRIANRPSDKEGERTVGNALVVVRQCVGVKDSVRTRMIRESERR